MTIENLSKYLVTVGLQIKWFHWQTYTKTEHETLGEFYAAWDALVDKFVESYAGKYQRPVGGGIVSFDEYQEGEALVRIKNVAEFLASPEVRGDIRESDLNNILDELQGLANHTAYLLTMKH